LDPENTRFNDVKERWSLGTHANLRSFFSKIILAFQGNVTSLTTNQPAESDNEELQKLSDPAWLTVADTEREEVKAVVNVSIKGFLGQPVYIGLCETPVLTVISYTKLRPSQRVAWID
jgi:hypothetical protein